MVELDKCSLWGSEGGTRARSTAFRKTGARATPKSTSEDEPRGASGISYPIGAAHPCWQLVSRGRKPKQNLALFSTSKQPNWIAIICGQDRPSLPNDERIHFLPFTESVEGNDKWGKLGKLVEQFPKVARPSGYVMTFDADDLTHRDLVSRFLTIQHDNGYVIDHGLVHDIAAAAYGQAGKPTPLSPLRKPFWKLCGSCAAFRYDPNEPRLFRDFLVALCQHEHRMFPYLARLSGRPLLAVLDNLVMYEVNHGENFDRRLNQGDFKLRFVKRFPVNDEDRLRDIEESFF